MAELIDRFWTHAQAYFRHADGTPTGEADHFKYPFAILNRLYDPTPVAAIQSTTLALELLMTSVLSRMQP